MDTFGKRLKRKREDKGLTQEELALKVGKASKQAISNWENGKAEPSISEVRELAKILSTTAGYLIDGDPSNQENTSSNENITITKDELINLQRWALQGQSKQIEAQNQSIENLKNMDAH